MEVIHQPVVVAHQAFIGEIGRDAAVLVVQLVAGEAGVACNQLLAARRRRWAAAIVGFGGSDALRYGRQVIAASSRVLRRPNLRLWFRGGS